MPNCDFYATPADHRILLDWLFREQSCQIYENTSDWEQPLRLFNATDEVLSQFERTYVGGKKWTSVPLQLYVLGAGPPFEPRKIALKPEACDGKTFRYSAAGLGLVQLYLESVGNDRLSNSHTNHNSQKRAETWANTVDDLSDPARWDFARIKSFSARLNRQIKKQSVAKIGSRPVLPGALELWNAGVALGPDSRATSSRLLLRRS
jgi:hypothetical protein